jgi:hypothetical protein
LNVKNSNFIDDKLTYLINASRPAELLEEIKDDEMRKKLDSHKLHGNQGRDKEKPQKAS